MSPSVYIETTIPSYLTAWPSGDLIRAGHQKITRDWWSVRRAGFDLYISQLVLDEAADGDAAAAADRLAALHGIPLIPATEQAAELAADIMTKAGLPAKASVDAGHIAVAACGNMDFLLTWNCRHINNAELAPDIEAACRGAGLACPVICTPEELMGL